MNAKLTFSLTPEQHKQMAEFTNYWKNSLPNPSVKFYGTASGNYPDGSMLDIEFESSE